MSGEGPMPQVADRPRAPASNPGFFERLWRGAVQIATRPGDFVLESLRRSGGSLRSAFGFYAGGLAVGLAAVEILGEANTGALYVFGGGVFGSVAGIGEWIAFAVTVPVIALSLRLLYWTRDVSLREHAHFALIFQGLVGVAIALETVSLALVPEGPLTGLTQWLYFGIAAVYFVLALKDRYDDSVEAALARACGVGSAVVLVWGIAAVVLATLTDFTL